MELITTYICKQFDIGIHSNMFGGRIMSLIDDAAGSYAAQLCDTPNVVTIKFDELVFKKPVKVGSILKIYGKVLRFGNTSLELYMEMRRHNVYTGLQEIVTHTNVKFVRIDEDGNAIPISELIKDRYALRLKQFGKGLLSSEARELLVLTEEVNA
ncbi:MAG: acyl-CoA thioesterase [Candidatus Fluviicola riflensis]|nr:MAG: acyl-CoA thioesterase [Candidatus Fluviicola riflensis]OGS76148.1 MAG: acyl-CoA thioesterase [Candidatus Fluviicola riflensis]OGS83308.1 MAG: acyl-CoA thioesterase [Fluviicola sp. RIFCSPHIGHO2_01_FULL_43_53]OGS83680.1 MAG: acyl-CoA thioesterase [Fluviicola sp. RIFCSPHIGHO2_12_FULL_43_24]